MVLVPGRDPRGDVISVAYIAVVPADRVRPEFGGELGWQPIRRLPVEVAFDHREIIDYALRRLRSKLGYSSLGFELLPEEFTIPELQAMYEQVLGISLNRGNFWRRVLDAGVIEDTTRTRRARASRRSYTSSPDVHSACSRNRMGGRTHNRKAPRSQKEAAELHRGHEGERWVVAGGTAGAAGVAEAEGRGWYDKLPRELGASSTVHARFHRAALAGGADRVRRVGRHRLGVAERGRSDGQGAAGPKRRYRCCQPEPDGPGHE